MKLAPNWRLAYRSYSLQALLIVGAIQGVVVLFDPAGVVPFMPNTTWKDAASACGLVTAILGVIGKYIDQGHVTAGPPDRVLVPVAVIEPPPTMQFADSLPSDVQEIIHRSDRT